MHEFIPHVTGYLCLQHSKVDAGQQAPTGFKALIMEDFQVFLPTFVFHLSVDTLLGHCTILAGVGGWFV